MTGTDTGVGKTAVASGLLWALRARGLDVGAFKPAESGHRTVHRQWPPDAAALAKSAGLDVPRRAVVPYVFRQPLAPRVAARLERVSINLPSLDAMYQSMQDSHQLTVVEGAGGLAVPLTRTTTMADVARRWNLPVLVVARPGLGTINHTVLTVKHAEAKGLRVAGVVINRFPDRPGAAERTNPQVIQDMTGVPVIGRVPDLDGVDVDAGRLEPLGPAIQRHVDLGPIMALARGRN